MSLCLIAVDVQMDLLPGGAIAVPDSDQILSPLSHLAREADLVVVSRDWHPDNHFSFSEAPKFIDGSWPPHCVQNTKGARIHISVRKHADITVSKGTNRNPPDIYSAFEAKTARPVRTLEEVLADYAIEKIVIGGLPLDITVRYTALDASALGYQTVVPLDLSRPMYDRKSVIETTNILTLAGVNVCETFDSQAQ